MSEIIDSKKGAKKQALGRGLGSLLGGVPTEAAAAKTAAYGSAFSGERPQALEAGFVEQKLGPLAPKISDHDRIWKLAIEKLIANPKQPRRTFEKESLQELARSIKEKGILQPIVARKRADGKFEIIAGERRWRAAQAAGLHDVPVILKESTDQNALELALIENIQREDLNPIEEAEAYAHIVKQYQITQQELADKVGKDRATVANILRLLGLQPEVRQMVAIGELSLGLAKVLLAIPGAEAQKEFAKKIKDQQLTVRAAERLIAAHLKQAADKMKITDIGGLDIASKLMTGLAEEIQKMLGTKVSIDYREGKGRLAVHFYSDEELNEIIDKLRSAWRK